MKMLKQKGISKHGKELIPQYLKEVIHYYLIFQDFPDPELLPAKELIAKLPSHVDRPPAEKFDAIILNLYKSMSKSKGGSQNKRKSKLKVSVNN